MIVGDYKLYRKKHLDTVFFDKFKTYHKFFDFSKPLVVFDVGANEGQTIEEYRERYPNSIIHAFEPDPVSFKKMKENTSEQLNLFYNNNALGKMLEKKELFQNPYDLINSFYKVDKKNDSVVSNIHPKIGGSFNVDSVVVDVMSLDDYVQISKVEKINILKIDVSGFEPEVLEGARNSLKNQKIDLINVQVLVDHIYEKNVSFTDLEKHLIPYGYFLYDICHIYKDINIGKTYWLDAIYISHSLK